MSLGQQFIDNIFSFHRSCRDTRPIVSSSDHPVILVHVMVLTSQMVPLASILYAQKDRDGLRAIGLHKLS